MYLVCDWSWIEVGREEISLQGKKVPGLFIIGNGAKGILVLYFVRPPSFGHIFVIWVEIEFVSGYLLALVIGQRQV